MSCKGCGKRGRLVPNMIPVDDGDSKTKYAEVCAPTRSDVIGKARAERYRMAHETDKVVFEITDPQMKRDGTWFILIPFCYKADQCK